MVGIPRRCGASAVFPCIVVAALASACDTEAPVSAPAPPPPAVQGGVPTWRVDPLWPKVPDKMLLGQVSGVSIDAQDHVWIIQRPNSLTPEARGATKTPPETECCIPAPPVMEFDSDGNYIQGWGGPGEGYEWPLDEHGIHVDYKGNVWLAAAGGPQSKAEHHLLKFTKEGKFLVQIGRRGQSKGSGDVANLNQASDMHLYQPTNELFVSDGYVNRRVIVFDGDTGVYKRHWGAYGNAPDDTAPRTMGAQPPGDQQFNLLHGLRVSNDGLVYVADRRNNRIQVFTVEGKFIKEGFVARQTGGIFGSAFGVAFSSDPEQKYLFMPDAGNNHVWVLDRQTLGVVTQFGRWGNYAGQFYGLHSLAVDSKGNIYTGEVLLGRRVQKFNLTGSATPLKP